MEDELNDLFDDNGENEKLFGDEVTENEKGNEENKIDDLVALFSDDEEEEDVTDIIEGADTKQQTENNENENGESEEKLQEEYLELQRKMQEIQKKMNKSISPKSESKPKSQHNNSGSNFLAAFGSLAPKTNTEKDFHSKVSTKKSPPKTTKLITSIPQSNSSKSFYGKRERTEDYAEDFQKRKRVAHEASANPNLAVGSPLQTKPKPNLQIKQKPIDLKVVSTEKYSRMRLKKCLVTNEEMTARMDGKKFVPLYHIRTTMSMSSDIDWVTIGAISKKIERQSKNGKAFSIWNLVDLHDTNRIVSFFLFGRVHEQLNKVNIGAVIGILNPTIMPPKKEDKSKGYDNLPALTVDLGERVMNIGDSADIGWCNATKWRNKQNTGTCLVPVNRQYNEVCPQHMQAKYKKLSSRRSELHGSPAAPMPDKYKNTMWNKMKGDTFFYGGKTFSATPPSLKQAGKVPSSKIKLQKIVSVAGKDASEVNQITRSKVIRAMMDCNEKQSVTGCSDAFADMLTSGDMVAGSRQFLGHLKGKQDKEIEEKKGDRITPSQFLKQQKTLFENKNLTVNPSRKSNLTRPLGNHNNVTSSPNLQKNFVSIADIKKKTQAIAQLKPKLHSPQLGGTKDEFSIDLSSDFVPSKSVSSHTPSLAELRKRKALAKLRGQDGKIGIEKLDPNNIKNNKKDQREVLKKVEMNRKDFSENIVKKSPPKETKKAGLLGMKLSKEDINKIAEMKSTHTQELEQAEAENEENYFKPRIQKEMMEQKMAETFEVQTKIVTCMQCKYTYWGPHNRCKVMKHNLKWENAAKKFFQCSKCKHRCVTWMTYPTKTCRDCGSEKYWKRTSMLNRSDVKLLDTEILLVRGIEHEKFLNTVH